MLRKSRSGGAHAYFHAAPRLQRADAAEGAATAKARADLDAYTGVWKVEADRSDVQVFPEAVAVTVVDDAVDEGESCENVKMGGGESVTVCHETTLSNGGATLTHTVKLTSYAAYVFPTGWSEATQVLTRSAGKMHYTYEVDGASSSDVVLVR